jgi:hypothetical protein
MTNQKKISDKVEEYQTPLQVLLSFLSLPHKIYRDIYISIIERRLSSTPLVHCAASTGFLARQQGIEPDLMSEKIQNMVRMKWIHFEQVGDRDSNQIFVISPVWRYKEDIDKAAFGIALQQYQGEIKEDKEHQMNTQEVYALMNSICAHTKELVDSELCKLGRFKECKLCTYRRLNDE